MNAQDGFRDRKRTIERIELAIAAKKAHLQYWQQKEIEAVKELDGIRQRIDGCYKLINHFCGDRIFMASSLPSSSGKDRDELRRLEAEAKKS